MYGDAVTSIASAASEAKASASALGLRKLRRRATRRAGFGGDVADSFNLCSELRFVHLPESGVLGVAD